MAYTASINKPGNQVSVAQGNAGPSSRSNFGNFRVDAGRNSMVGIANYMQSIDATTVPVASPITNGSAAGITLTVPANAISLYIYIVSAVTAIVGEDSTFVAGLFIPTATLCGPFYCANQQFVYIKPSSGTNSIYFQFQTV